MKIIQTNKLNKITNFLSYFLIVVFAVRIGCYNEQISSIVGLNNAPYSKFISIIAILAIWMEYACVVLLICNNFFKIKILNIICRFICPVITIVNMLLVSFINYLLCGVNGFSILFLFLIIENITCFLLEIAYFCIDSKDKSKLKEVFKALGIFCLLLIPCMPSYTFQYLFGYLTAAIGAVKEITFIHRVMLYIGLITPIIIYFSLRNKSKDVIRFYLIYISITTMIGFMVNYYYKTFTTPWAWPFHLCNTAMFIIPICLIFKLKKLFYFTYFINVLGAFLAMLMPNYDAATNLFSMRMFNFWYNHWIAFFMPLLIVALKEFKRPSLKEFKWSMIWFFGYFCIALIFNVVFTALGHPVDYFFLNSNYVGDKLGNWADDLFNLSTSFSINNIVFEFHPFYQLLFFITYVALGLGVWFVYTEFFRIADSHYELYVKLHAIKIDKWLKKDSYVYRKEEYMNGAINAELELKHFSKKYATSKNYAVNDANFKVNAGEIFGFLGPNGAGKSTIIKSIVGIQPIIEGNIEVCGFDVAKNPVATKANIGYVPDHYALYEKLTGREYINYIADIFDVSEEDRNERLNNYIKLFQLESSIDSKIKTYSHGMKQKITIMAALIHNPKVWILDEPLTGLDPNSIYQVKECMRQHAAAGNIVFFSSHLIDIVEKLCGRIAIIKKGQIQCIKSVEEIEKSNVSLEKFYMSIVEDNKESA